MLCASGYVGELQLPHCTDFPCLWHAASALCRAR
jgi:hypothetical protein